MRNVSDRSIAPWPFIKELIPFLATVPLATGSMAMATLDDSRNMYDDVM